MKSLSNTEGSDVRNGLQLLLLLLLLEMLKLLLLGIEGGGRIKDTEDTQRRITTSLLCIAAIFQALFWNRMCAAQCERYLYVSVTPAGSLAHSHTHNLSHSLPLSLCLCLYLPLFPSLSLSSSSLSTPVTPSWVGIGCRCYDRFGFQTRDNIWSCLSVKGRCSGYLP